MHLSIIPWPFVVKIVCELCVHTENSKKKKSTLNTPMMHLKKMNCGMLDISCTHCLRFNYLAKRVGLSVTDY